MEVRARAHVSPQQVWTVLADTASWADWAPFDEVTVEKGHEIGEIRRLRSGRITTRERIVGFEPPRRYVYEIISGLPIRDYVAEVLFSPLAGDGTEVRWQARFRPKIPGTGWVLKRLLQGAVRKGADALVRRADGLR
ncbi:MAG TPA: SRPBCC family protein [Candidatus Limnocylindrales bacterium]|nr:SRPBCC family protein [Candidatus Limnocylindrales bacterium]